MKRNEKTKRLVESSLMIALGTVLSILPIVEMPYGGSVTVASMLPCLLIAYRHGLGWGLGTGAVYAVLQQLLGLKNLSYFTTWQSIVAIILLDYLIAFVVIGFGGIFRRVIKQQNLSLAAGALLASVLRYICHVISGATVWAGLSIPTEAALAYSLGYNATYMIPETIVLVLVAYYLGTVMDFRRETPVRMAMPESGNKEAGVLGAIAMLIGVVASVVDVSLIFAHLQNPETGSFDITMLAAEPFVESFWLTVVVITAVALAGIAVLLFRRRAVLTNAAE